jgi:transposase
MATATVDRPTSLDGIQAVVGIDIGSLTCSYTVLTRAKAVLRKPAEFANTAAGFATLAEQLARLDLTPEQILVGLEATSRYWENLYYFLVSQGYRVQVLHPAQTHAFAQQRGLRAKTDRLDAGTIARTLLSDEVRPVYVASATVVAYRELVRLRQNLSDEAARHKLEIQSALQVGFPEYREVFADPTRPSALALLKVYPSAAAFVEAGIAAVQRTVEAVAGERYGGATARTLVRWAEHSAASGVARAAREAALRILCTQLEQTQANLAAVERELDGLVAQDTAASNLSSVPEFGPKTVAVLRGELGEVARFQRRDEVVAYAGLDLRVRQSGKWKGQLKLSKRGSSLLRRALYMAALQSLRMKGSAFGAYYRHLVEQGVAKMSALMAVMRKMLLVAYGILKSEQQYDASKVWAAPKPPLGATTPEEAPAAA